MKTKTIVWLLIIATIALAAVDALTVGLPKIEQNKVIVLCWGVLMLFSFICNLIQRRELKIMLRDVGGGLLLLGFILAACRFGYAFIDWLNVCEDDTMLLSGFFLASLYPVCVGILALYCYWNWFSGWKENVENILTD